MKSPFELKPIIVAAVAGAVLAEVFMVTLVNTSSDSSGNVSQCAYTPLYVGIQGAGIGIGVQIIVRILGVS